MLRLNDREFKIVADKLEAMGYEIERFNIERDGDAYGDFYYEQTYNGVKLVSYGVVKTAIQCLMYNDDKNAKKLCPLAELTPRLTWISKIAEVLYIYDDESVGYAIVENDLSIHKVMMNDKKGLSFKDNYNYISFPKKYALLLAYSLYFRLLPAYIMNDKMLKIKSEKNRTGILLNHISWEEIPLDDVDAEYERSLANFKEINELEETNAAKRYRTRTRKKDKELAKVEEKQESEEVKTE